MLSIIIPTYKEEAAIEKTLKTLRENPPAGEYEIIVSDSTSPDKTAEIAKKYADKVVVSKRSTIAAGRNAGAREAKGKYIAFVDSGVGIPDLRHFFDKLILLFERDPKLVGVTVPLRVYKENSTIGISFFHWLLNTYYRLMNNVFHLGSSAGKFQMARADAFRKIGGYQEQMANCEDQDLFIRLARIGRTRSETSLSVFHEARRAHVVWWPKLLLLGVVNGFSTLFLKRSFSKEWKEVR